MLVANELPGQMPTPDANFFFHKQDLAQVCFHVEQRKPHGVDESTRALKNERVDESLDSSVAAGVENQTAHLIKHA